MSEVISKLLTDDSIPLAVCLLFALAFIPVFPLLLREVNTIFESRRNRKGYDYAVYEQKLKIAETLIKKHEGEQLFIEFVNDQIEAVEIQYLTGLTLHKKYIPYVMRLYNEGIRMESLVQCQWRFSFKENKIQFDYSLFDRAFLWMANIFMVFGLIGFGLFIFSSALLLILGATSISDLTFWKCIGMAVFCFVLAYFEMITSREERRAKMISEACKKLNAFEN